MGIETASETRDFIECFGFPSLGHVLPARDILHPARLASVKLPSMDPFSLCCGWVGWNFDYESAAWYIELFVGVCFASCTHLC